MGASAVEMDRSAAGTTGLALGYRQSEQLEETV
jgi:hypothetical protein